MTVKYNPEQKSCIKEPGHLAILAGPGSGKTATIIGKTQNILTHSPDARIGMVTFTNKAAAEMEERLTHLLGPSKASKITVGTFHRLAIDQIKQSKPGLRVTNAGVKRIFLKRAMDATGELNDIAAISSEVERFQNGFIGKLSESARVVWEKYLELSEGEKQVDLGSVCSYASEKMKSGDLPPYSFTHLVVDEFQDVDVNQLRWVLLHAQAGCTIIVVGDDDQSIYAFRGALGYKAYSLLIKQLKPKIIKLTRNYRCAKTILSHANHLIECNQERLSKELMAESKLPGVLNYHRFNDEEELGMELARRIGESQGDWGILARTNGPLEAIADDLSSFGINTEMSSKNNFWDDEYAIVFIDSLRYVLSSGRHRKYLTNTLYMCGWTEADIGAFLKHQEQIKTGILVSLSNAALALKDGNAKGAIQAVYTGLSQNSNRGVIDQERAFKVWGQITDMILKSRLSLADFIKSLSIKGEGDKERSRVNLMTFHGSKGLEFDNVWIVGLNEELMPNARLMNSLEEERRLMFVAMTRAKSQLHLSWYAGKNSYTRFLDELPSFDYSKFDNKACDKRAIA